MSSLNTSMEDDSVSKNMIVTATATHNDNVDGDDEKNSMSLDDSVLIVATSISGSTSSTHSNDNLDGDDDEKKEDNVMALDDSSQEPEREYILVTSDGETITVPYSIAIKSELLETLIKGDKDETTFPLSEITHPILSLAVEFLHYHVKTPFKQIEKVPLKTANMIEIVDEWDANFIDVEQEVIIKLILGANYMHIPDLLSLACAKIASMIKGKSTEEIRKTFNIVNDFTSVHTTNS